MSRIGVCIWRFAYECAYEGFFPQTWLRLWHWQKPLPPPRYYCRRWLWDSELFSWMRRVYRSTLAVKNMRWGTLFCSSPPPVIVTEVFPGSPSFCRHGGLTVLPTYIKKNRGSSSVVGFFPSNPPISLDARLPTESNLLISRYSPVFWKRWLTKGMVFICNTLNHTFVSRCPLLH